MHARTHDTAQGNGTKDNTQKQRNAEIFDLRRFLGTGHKTTPNGDLKPSDTKRMPKNTIFENGRQNKIQKNRRRIDGNTKNNKKQPERQTAKKIKKKSGEDSLLQPATGTGGGWVCKPEETRRKHAAKARNKPSLPVFQTFRV